MINDKRFAAALRKEFHIPDGGTDASVIKLYGNTLAGALIRLQLAASDLKGAIKKAVTPVWLNKLRHIVSTHEIEKQHWADQMEAADRRIYAAERRVNEAEKIIRERTDISIDLPCHLREHNTIILVGRYANRDYVEVINTGNTEFHNFVHVVRDMKRHGIVLDREAQR